MRGQNNGSIQNEVLEVCKEFGTDLILLFETKIKNSRYEGVRMKFNDAWKC